MFVGVTVKVVPLHTVTLIGLMMAIGFTNTVTVKLNPAPQLTVVGVTIYVAVCTRLVGFDNVPLIFKAPVPVIPPVNPPVTEGVDQL